MPNAEQPPALRLVRQNSEAYLVWVRVVGPRAIFTYIEADNPAAAALIDEPIVAAVRRLLDFPASGHMGRIAGTREFVINGTRYIAAYAITERAVRILRVLHGAQEWPEHLPLS